MASITAAGTGSGLDIETIIETLTDAERIPTETRLANREVEIQANISAYGSLKGALQDFQDALSGLSSLQELAARTATSSDEDLFTVSAGSGAAVGNTSIEVTQLASNHKLISGASFADGDAAVGAGTISISMGGESFDVTIVGGSNNTLSGIRDAINEAEDN
ncbi:MAG: flagellar cap protein FliD N-terminal domain-containing protein, partial [Ketobacter sp.]